MIANLQAKWEIVRTQAANYMNQRSSFLTAILFGCLLLVIIDESVEGQGTEFLELRPRRFPLGYFAIYWCPVLHEGFGHLIANSVPFFVLAYIIMGRSMKKFFIVTAFIAIAAGHLAWAMGRETTEHVGLSGLLYGYLGYILVLGLIEDKALNAIIAVVTMAMYAGFFLGFATKPKMSWELHLWSLIMGAIAAYAELKIFDEAATSEERRGLVGDEKRKGGAGSSSSNDPDDAPAYATA